jgi:large subunit ribosomal protein L25
MYNRSGNSVPLDLDALEFTNGVKGISESTIVKVDVNGNVHEAFVKSTQRNITDGKVVHVDFYEIEQGVAVRTRIALHLEGTPQGVRDGGVMEFPLHEVEVECLPKDLPEGFSIDVSSLGVNQSIHVRDLALGEAIKVLSNPDQVVVLVKFTKAETVVEEEAAAAEASEAPAAEAPAKEKA